jgi:BirA family transcriptional regulator, biotin operon repressor / biotin---[acetyl-CoA-carboxylase] ligase
LNSAIAHAAVRHYATVGSTNTEAERLWQSGERGPLFLLADEQTAGKGRRGRSWASTKGNCYSTLLMTLEAPLETVPQIGFVVALAVADVVRTHAPGAEPRLKWPNDVLVDRAKIAGILSEVVASQPVAVAIGCGINIAHAPHDLAYSATSLAALGSSTSCDEVFETYRQRLNHWMAMWGMGHDFDTIRKAWTLQAIGIGEVVEFKVADKLFTGRMEGLRLDGALLIRESEHTCHSLLAGDLMIPSLQVSRGRTS